MAGSWYLIRMIHHMPATGPHTTKYDVHLTHITHTALHHTTCHHHTSTWYITPHHMSASMASMCMFVEVCACWTASAVASASLMAAPRDAPGRQTQKRQMRTRTEGTCMYLYQCTCRTYGCTQEERGQLHRAHTVYVLCRDLYTNGGKSP